MSNQGNALAGATSLLMPMPETPVRGAQAPANANIVATVLSIEHVPIIESNITWTELNDTNWNA
jgi:hypothetical protein